MELKNNYFDWIPMRWGKRLERARSRGYFSKQEKHIARSWDTCGIGERRSTYKWPGEDFTRESQEKRNTAHIDLGIAFFDAIYKNDIEGAITAYSIIQQTFPLEQDVAPEPVSINQED